MKTLETITMFAMAFILLALIAVYSVKTMAQVELVQCNAQFCFDSKQELAELCADEGGSLNDGQCELNQLAGR